MGGQVYGWPESISLNSNEPEHPWTCPTAALGDFGDTRGMPPGPLAMEAPDWLKATGVADHHKLIARLEQRTRKRGRTGRHGIPRRPASGIRTLCRRHTLRYRIRSTPSPTAMRHASVRRSTAALKFAGYDYRFEFGDGGHNAKRGGKFWPESRGWPWQDVTANRAGKYPRALVEVLK